MDQKRSRRCQVNRPFLKGVARCALLKMSLLHIKKVAVLVLGVFALSGQAFAVTYSANPVYGPLMTGFASQSAACSAGSAQFVSVIQSGAVPPISYTLNSAVWGSPTCTANYRQNYSGGYGDYTQNIVIAEEAAPPPVNLCLVKAGIPGVTNFTVGYSRTPNANDEAMVGGANQLPAGGQICDAGCTVSLSSGVMAWQSQTPTAQGLYRWSVDLVSVPTGAECTMGTSDAPANPVTAAPVCPGFVGDINGVKGCYGTSSAPVATTAGNTLGASKAAGNPSAGVKPLSGSGSGSTGAGRTPAAGNGGNAGGPSSSSVVGGMSVAPGGAGTTVAPPAGQEQAACGAPGQPKCGIDETGTPVHDPSKFTLDDATLNAAALAKRNTIQGTGDKGFFGGWAGLIALPTPRACEPVSMPVYAGFTLGSMDICPGAEWLRGLMGFVWAAAGLAFCWKTVEGTI